MGMQDVTAYQWIVLLLGAAGFIITWTRTTVTVTRAVDKIQMDTAEKISEETNKVTERLGKMMEQFEQDQRTQDNRFGEVGLSIRQYIVNVEKEMHQIEIWGRDNFVLKSDFMKATERLEHAIKDMAADIRTDMRTLASKIDGMSKE
jgi:predicted NBD/HSP70 family sugar kinase